jgi:hypothetical protein
MISQPQVGPLKYAGTQTMYSPAAIRPEAMFAQLP